MKTIAIANNKGGTGKSSAVINIAHAMQISGKSVCVIDCDDSQLNTLKFFENSNLDIVCKSINDSDIVSDECDFTLLDLPPALNDRTKEILSYCDFVFVPIELGTFAIQGVARITETIAATGAKFGGCFINRFDRYNPSDCRLEELLRGSLGGKIMTTRILASRAIKNSVSYGLTVFEYWGWGEAAKAYTALTQEIILKVAG